MFLRKVINEGKVISFNTFHTDIPDYIYEARPASGIGAQGRLSGQIPLLTTLYRWSRVVSGETFVLSDSDIIILYLHTSRLCSNKYVSFLPNPTQLRDAQLTSGGVRAPVGLSGW